MPHIKVVIRCFYSSDFLHSVWQSLGTTIFCNFFLLLSVSVLFPPSPLQSSHLRKSQAHSRPQSLGQLRNQPCTAAASVNLSLPFSPPSVPPVCSLTWLSVLLQQGLCTGSPPGLEGSSFSGCMIHSLFLRCLQVSQGADFPRLLRPHIKACCPLLIPHTALCLLPLPLLPPERLFPWGRWLSLPLGWWRAAGERELCCVLLHPRTRGGPRIR